MTRILLSISATVMVGCTSFGTVVVRSNPPDANVFIFDSKTGQNSLMGKTPMTFSKSLATGKQADVFQLRFEKEGFESKFAAVSAFGRETTYVDVKLSSTQSANSDVRRAFEVNRQLMIEANRLAAAKRFSEALVRVEKVLETDPKNDEAHAARGSLMYLMKDFDGARVAWQRALEINPSNDMVRSSLVDLNLNLVSPKRSPANSAEGQ